MKKVFLFIVSALATLSAVAATGQNDGIITVKTNKVARPLVEQWANAYKAIHPNVEFEFVSAKAKDADLTLTNIQTDEANVTYVGRYALLPVTSAANPLKADIERKTWSAKDLKRLFFIDEELDDDLDGASKSRKEKLADKLTVFTGSHSMSWTPALAAYFGYTKDDVKGNKVAGDDIYLLNAIEEEPASVTFSSLSFLYNLQSRDIRTDITLLPLNVKKDQGEAFANLDAVIDVLEHQRIDAIPVEPIGFTYQKADSDIEQFLAWVLSEGQAYNHAQGFLQLDEKDAKQQKKLLAEK